MVVKGYEDNLGAPLRAVREDVEREWSGRLAAEETKRKEAEEWATELARALEKEKKVSATVIPKKKSLRGKPELINIISVLCIIIGTAAAGRRTSCARDVRNQVRLPDLGTLFIILPVEFEQHPAHAKTIPRAPAADRRIPAAH